MNEPATTHDVRAAMPEFRDDEAFAHELDAADPLRKFRDQFAIPRAGQVVQALGLKAPPGVIADRACVYLTGNSLGCMPRRAAELVVEELDDWARLGVEGHLHGRRPWLSHHEQVRGPLARLVGAREHEVVAMNSLTVNLHLLMLSFYRPTAKRCRIIIEDSAFPSDSYAVASQAQLHRLAPGDAVVRLRARAGEHTLRTADVVEAIAREGERLALVMLGGVNYLTGQVMQMEEITRAAHCAGAACGWDLAHGVGNVPLSLHDWGADFAVWCSYKYLNAGPGAVAGAFVHERHVARPDLPQLAGWWGNDPATRFKMGPTFEPVASADRWQLSNPPVLALAPLIASLALFDQAGLGALRAKSLRLWAYARALIDRVNAESAGAMLGEIRVLTPAEPAQRGCQLSLVFPGDARLAHRRLAERGIVCDFREPDVIRAAPVPLYNSYHDVWRFATAMRSALLENSSGRAHGGLA